MQRMEGARGARCHDSQSTLILASCCLFGAVISTAKQSHPIPYTTELLDRLISRGGQFFHLYQKLSLSQKKEAKIKQVKKNRNELIKHI